MAFCRCLKYFIVWNILLFIIAGDVPPPYYGQPAPAPAPVNYPQQQVIIWFFLNNHWNEQYLEHNPVLEIMLKHIKNCSLYESEM